jgi:outer membrane protein assembly factor BamB
VIGGLVLAALLVTAFAGVRVFRPGDTLDVAHTPYPAPVTAQPQFYGELLRAPLFVQGRIRVYGASNRVFADGPADLKMTTSAYWALRRWPARLVGVAVAEDRVVVSQWSDGMVYGQRPETGAVAWKADAGSRATSYAGRRTGAETVYDPPDLFTTNDSVVAVAPDSVYANDPAVRLTGLDPDTGRVLWQQSSPRCDEVFTGPTVVVCARPSTVDVWDSGTGAARTWPDLHGATTPVGCAVGRSRCTGLAGDGGPGWVIGSDGDLSAANALTRKDDLLSGPTVVSLENDTVTAYETRSGTVRWSQAADGARLLAIEPGEVHLLAGHDVVTLNLANGYQRSRIYAHVPDTNETPWTAGYAYASHGYVVIERVWPGVPKDHPDTEYYFPVPSLVLTGS